MVEHAGYRIPDIPIEKAIEVYKKSLERVSRDTGLSYALFDPETVKMGSAHSAKALKAILWKTEMIGSSYINALTDTFRSLLNKMLKTYNIDIDFDNISISFSPGVHDAESEIEMVQKRNGGAVTMSVEDSLVVLDKVSKDVAINSARKLQGLEPIDNSVDARDTYSGDSSVVSDVDLTYVGSSSDDDTGSSTDRAYLLGTPDIKL